LDLERCLTFALPPGAGKADLQPLTRALLRHAFPAASHSRNPSEFQINYNEDEDTEEDIENTEEDTINELLADATIPRPARAVSLAQSAGRVSDETVCDALLLLVISRVFLIYDHFRSLPNHRFVSILLACRCFCEGKLSRSVMFEFYGNFC
jgi:hypothetical protein